MRKLTAPQRQVLDALKSGWTLSYYAFSDVWTLHENDPATARRITASTARAIVHIPGVNSLRLDTEIRYTWKP